MRLRGEKKRESGCTKKKINWLEEKKGEENKCA